MSRLDEIENEVQDLKDGQTTLHKRVDEQSIITSARVNETNVHLSHEIVELQVKLSEATNVFSSQSEALSSKIDSLSRRTDTITIIASSLVTTTNILSTATKALRSKVDSLSTRTDTITVIASSLVNTTNTLSNETDALSSKVDSLSTHANTLTIITSSLVSTTHILCSETSALSSKVNSLSNQTGSLTSSVDTLSSNTGTLTNRVGLVTSRMDGLTSAVQSLGERADNLTTAASSLVSSTEGLTTKVNFLDNQVYTLTNKVKKVSFNVKDLNNTVASIEGPLNYLTSTVTVAAASLFTITSIVNDLDANLTRKIGMLDSKSTTLTNTVSVLSVQVGNLTSLACMLREKLEREAGEVKGDVLLLRERVEELHRKADIQVNTTRALAIITQPGQESTCTGTEVLFNALLKGIWQHQALSLITDKIPYHYFGVNSTSPCKQLAEDYPTANSGYYWVTNQTGNPVSTFCIITSELNPASSCQQLTRDHPYGASDFFWVKNENGTTVNVYCAITSELNPASSCQQLSQDHPHAASDYYWVSNGAMQPVRVYCDMDQHCCNSTGGWVRIADIDVTDPNQQCPPGFNLRTDVRSCGRDTTSHSCTSITFLTDSIEYRQVCGRIRAYLHWNTWAFYEYHKNRNLTIDQQYVDGMSLTHGRYSRQHIWTFASARSERYSNLHTCPCTRTDKPYTGAIPPFISEDYFCDTAANNGGENQLSPENPLWDGQGCGQNSTCCSFNRPPWFCKQLPQPTTDDLDLRVCGGYDYRTPFDQIELYVQ